MLEPDVPAEARRGNETESPSTARADLRAAQQRRFLHHLIWSAAGSIALAVAVYLLFGALWPTLSFLALMLMMSVFFAAYYAMLRIE